MSSPVFITENRHPSPPGDDAYVAKTGNAIFYFNAHATDRNWSWRGSDDYYDLQGYDEKKGFKKKTAPEGKRGAIYRVSLIE